MRMLRPNKRGKRHGQIIHRRERSRLFETLELLPLPKHLMASLGDRFSENVRMTADKLFANSPDDVVELEGLSFACHLRVHDHMKQQIAKLFPQIGILRQVDRLNSFTALLAERLAQTLVSLLAIPGTAPGRTKTGDNFPQPGDVTRITHATANFWFR